MSDAAENHQIGTVEFALEIGPIGLIAQHLRGGAAAIGDAVILRHDGITMDLDVQSRTYPCQARFITRSAKPAATPPRTGAIRKSQSWPSAFPPTMRAGPNERAGLTESPVTLTNGKWRATSVNPTISPAIAPK